MDVETEEMLDQLERVPNPERVISRCIRFYKVLDFLYEKLLHDDSLDLDSQSTWYEIEEELESKFDGVEFRFSMLEHFLMMYIGIDGMWWTFHYEKYYGPEINRYHLTATFQQHCVLLKGKLAEVKSLLCAYSF